MLKTVGTSGQVTLGKKLAGRHFEMEQLADGSIMLVPVTITRSADENQRASVAAGKPAGASFHVFKVDDSFELPDREQLHQRRR